MPAGEPLAMALAQVRRDEHGPELAADQRLGRMPEDLLDRPVDLDDPPVGADRDHRVKRRVEHRPLARLAVVHRGLGAPVDDELAREPAEAGERGEQIVVGRLHRGGQELDRPAGAGQRQRERRVQAGLGRIAPAREVLVAC